MLGTGRSTKSSMLYDIEKDSENSSATSELFYFARYFAICKNIYCPLS